MPESFRRFENLFRLLSIFVFTLTALGLLLVPGRLGLVTEDMSVVVCILLGVSVYIAGLLNQVSFFIVRPKVAQQIINIVVLIFLGVLSFIYFHAHLIIDGIALFTMGCAQLYLLLLHEHNDKTEENVFFLGYAGLNLISGLLLLFGLVDPIAYQNLGTLKNYLGIAFLIGGMAGFTPIVFPSKQVTRILAKAVAFPWIIWVLIFIFVPQLSTVIIAFGFAILPFLTDIGSWNKLRLPPSDFIGHKIIRIASIAELLMVISVVYIGYNSQGSLSQNESLARDVFFLTNQDFSFFAMLVAKGFIIYGLIIVVLTINRLTAELSNPDFNEKEFAQAPFIGWGQWISRSVNSFVSSSRNLRTKIEIQSEQIASLAQQLNNEKKRTAQLNLLAELSHQLETQLDQPVAAQLAVNTLQRALDCKHVVVFENEIVSVHPG